MSESPVSNVFPTEWLSVSPAEEMALSPQMRIVRLPHSNSYALMRDCVEPSLLMNGSSGTFTSRQFMPFRTALHVAPSEPGGPMSAAHA